MKNALPTAWEDAVNGWASWLKIGGKSSRTIRTRKGHVEALARLVGTRHPGEVTIRHLEMSYSDREYSLEHRRGARISLIQFYAYCNDRQITDVNPALDLPRIPEDKPNPRPAPDWMWKELKDTAEPRELLMVRLAGQAGLRREEIAKVHRDDVLWDGVGFALRVNGKGGKQRVVPIGESLAEALQRRPSWIPDGMKFEYLFPSIDKWGNRIAPHLTADRVGRLISDLMPPGWSAHKLRHRYATKGYAGTRNLRAVQVALGHATVATTQRYTATTEPEVRAVCDAVED